MSKIAISLTGRFSIYDNKEKRLSQTVFIFKTISSSIPPIYFYSNVITPFSANAVGALTEFHIVDKESEHPILVKNHSYEEFKYKAVVGKTFKTLIDYNRFEVDEKCLKELRKHKNSGAGKFNSLYGLFSFTGDNDLSFNYFVGDFNFTETTHFRALERWADPYGLLKNNGCFKKDSIDKIEKLTSEYKYKKK